MIERYMNNARYISNESKKRNIKFVDYLYSVKYYNNFTYFNKHIPEL